MNQAKNEIFRAPALLAVVFAIGFLVVGFLYFKETQKDPEVVIQEVIKEVPVEVVKEIPVEVVKDVSNEFIEEQEMPINLNDPQEVMITLAKRYVYAPRIKERNEIFYGINSLKTRVILDDEVKELITEESVKDRLELNLKKRGIQIDEGSPQAVIIAISGMWNQTKMALVYQYELVLVDYVVLNRDGDMRGAVIDAWKTSGFGLTGSSMSIRDHIIECIDEVSETLANGYLETVEKEKKKKGQGK